MNTPSQMYSSNTACLLFFFAVFSFHFIPLRVYLVQFFWYRLLLSDVKRSEIYWLVWLIWRQSIIPRPTTWHTDFQGSSPKYYTQIIEQQDTQKSWLIIILKWFSRSLKKTRNGNRFISEPNTQNACDACIFWMCVCLRNMWNMCTCNVIANKKMSHLTRLINLQKLNGFKPSINLFSIYKRYSARAVYIDCYPCIGHNCDCVLCFMCAYVCLSERVALSSKVYMYVGCMRQRRRFTDSPTVLIAIVFACHFASNHTHTHKCFKSFAKVISRSTFGPFARLYRWLYLLK